MKLFFDLKELSEAISFSPSWIRTQLENPNSDLSKFVRPIHVSAKSVRYSVDDVKAFVEHLRNQPTIASSAPSQVNI
jgi:hypothetical protein